MLIVSVGVPAYNEEANIGYLLESLLSQRLKRVKVKEIIVVVSGCTDQTVEVVKKLARKNPKIKLHQQTERLGKTSANNLFFQKAKSEILVLACADTLLKKDCLEKLIAPFNDPKMGMTAARMIPLNDRRSFSGYFSHLWWRLFHRVALKFFRSGELLAFRKLVKRIPKSIGADEVYLTDAILSKGYQARYMPLAIAYNMGPQTIKDIIHMRRRHACLHFEFRRRGQKVYYPKTMDNFYVFSLFLKEIKWRSFRHASFALLAAFVEGLSRGLAYFDFYLGGRNYQVWSRSESTKKLVRKSNV